MFFNSIKILSNLFFKSKITALYIPNTIRNTIRISYFFIVGKLGFGLLVWNIYGFENPSV